MKYKIILPPEIEDVIKGLGYDVKSYFNARFILPLTDELTKRIQKTILLEEKKNIDTLVNQVSKNINIEKVNS